MENDPWQDYPPPVFRAAEEELERLRKEAVVLRQMHGLALDAPLPACAYRSPRLRCIEPVTPYKHRRGRRKEPKDAAEGEPLDMLVIHTPKLHLRLQRKVG